ncbi:MAG: metal ABC transporter permease [Fimbriimonadaceae bacterium]|nr:metal ABC transporter permease [Fimbriimonadaceae bacterium]QYK58820.1 MAG: metal ABC transporter permease [Fimbriimonadaceae bacterium]
MVAGLTAAGCALAGVYLVLGRRAMMADAISHSLLPGLVAAYLLAQGPNILAGTLGAVAAGLATVAGVEWLSRGRRLHADSAIGVVFPFMFAVGVLWVSLSFSNLHIDTDAVLFGEIAFAPIERLTWEGRDFGPVALWQSGTLVIINALFLLTLGKELKIVTFDETSADLQGVSPVRVKWALVTVVCLTTVVAFSAVGAVLAVGLLVAPVAVAQLLTRRLPVLFVMSLVVGVGASLAGHLLALAYDVSISGTIAAVMGGLFLAAWTVAPEQGWVAQWASRKRQAAKLKVQTLVVHVAEHRGTQSQSVENTLEHLVDELGWARPEAEKAVRRARDYGWIRLDGPTLELTDQGLSVARSIL